MATGDQNDFEQRLASLLAPSWFGTGLTVVDQQQQTSDTPVLDSLLMGPAYNLAWIYVLYQYVLQQSRIATASGVWLDRISYDFCGNRLPRRSGETDASFRARILREIFRPRQTRPAIIEALNDLTGLPAIVQEPWNPTDWGGYGQSHSGYGMALGYGSLQYNNQVFVTAVRPQGLGIPNISGYGSSYAGYGANNGFGEYSDLSQLVGPVTDDEIYDCVAQIVAAGITAWVAIVDFIPDRSKEGGFRFNESQPSAMPLGIWQGWF